MNRRGLRWWGTLVIAAAAVWTAAAARPEVPASPPPPPLVVEVAYGDSLWTLAREYGDPDRDVRDVVAAMMAENDVTPERLMPGQRLAIPAPYAARSAEH